MLSRVTKAVAATAEATNMGAGGSKHADVAAAIKAFGKDELEKIKNFYAGMEDSKVKNIDPEQFRVCFYTVSYAPCCIGWLPLHPKFGSLV